MHLIPLLFLYYNFTTYLVL